jgi:hypothetical protein
MSRAPPRLAALLAVTLAVIFGDSAAADVTVPVQLQAQLVAKIAAFDRNFAARAAGGARVLVVQKAASDESAAVALRFARALTSIHDVGGVAAQVDIVDFTSAAELVDRCKAQHVALVYVSAGLEAEMAAMAPAFAGADVLTVGATGAFAERGAVVGFDLEEGRPRIVINAGRAREQNVSFKSELLKLARVVATAPNGAP